ncbi:MAG: hypothetical protein A3J46_05190 [Candidatus Yanofskybacteria bacterium RIFCSPHIGHO2_02_FULL_41_11]|uniref:tRNA/rRNA methyltransferase SpoU type domain-containing protein n=1 Tax=Candidatus Yanofskybacteria bacterium RIFCSPHIGHO2_02_FULL_41_11 TaxID=1802675 RepID=A0A1F8FA38_9BACT|nr:MAG: hypothetical protein A3J46_05190 [Candidatus Yanofskybacteria bacterium RIFCSPHIGHO2_02_FULL_41_11]
MKKEICLVLDNIRSRENVGSIFRTADGAGVKKIYLCGITPTPQVGNPKFEILNPKQIQNSKFQIQNQDKITKTALGADPVVENQAASLKENLIYTTGQGSDKISKTALGAENYVPWEYQSQTYRCLLKIKNQSSKIKILGLEQTKNSKNIFGGSTSNLLRSNLNKKIALVVGNEVKGISPKILKYCDEVVHIPMYGRKESLNVAVAVGIAVYQIRASWRSD